MLLKNIIRTNKIFHIVLLVSFVGLVAAGCATKKSEDEGSQEEGDEPVAAALPETAPIPEVGANPEQLNSGGGGAASSPTAPSHSSVTTGSNSSGQSRAVYYVKAGGATLFDQPSKGRSAGKLKKGDHVLVSVEGEWARTDNGKFISMKDLSTKGIAPAKSAAVWSKGTTKNAYKAPKAKKKPRASAEPKAAEPKAAEPKAAEPKAAEPKAAEPKAAEPKAAEPATSASPQPSDSGSEEVP